MAPRIRLYNEFLFFLNFFFTCCMSNICGPGGYPELATMLYEIIRTAGRKRRGWISNGEAILVEIGQCTRDIS